MLFLDEKGRTDNYYIDGFIHYLHKLTNDFHLQGFKKYGFEEKDIELICSVTDIKNNPVNLTAGDLKEIVRSRVI